MSKKEQSDLLQFLSPFSNDIRTIVLELRNFVWDLYPESNELIYDNYNAVAFGWSTSDKLGDTFCTIAVGRTSNNIHFGFYRGHEIEDPEKILIGSGNQYRYILVKDLKLFPKIYMKKLVKNAHANSLARRKELKEHKEGLTIVKSVSEKKRTLKKKPK
jgi:hypothetical protein